MITVHQVVEFSWTPVTEDADGNRITDLSGYEIAVRWALAEKPLHENTLIDPTVTGYVIDKLDPGDYVVSLTALTESGGRSKTIEQAFKVVQQPVEPVTEPAAPDLSVTSHLTEEKLR